MRFVGPLLTLVSITPVLPSRSGSRFACHCSASWRTTPHGVTSEKGPSGPSPLSDQLLGGVPWSLYASQATQRSNERFFLGSTTHMLDIIRSCNLFHQGWGEVCICYGALVEAAISERERGGDRERERERQREREREREGQIERQIEREREREADRERERDR